MIIDLLLYTFALVVGTLLGWSARDARYRRRGELLPAGTTTITVPYYVVHWRQVPLTADYSAHIPRLDAVVIDVNYAALRDAVHDEVTKLTGTDRFWLDWRAVDADSS